MAQRKRSGIYKQILIKTQELMRAPVFFYLVKSVFYGYFASFIGCVIEGDYLDRI